MIFGRNTQQWNGVLMATAGFVKLVLSQLVVLALLTVEVAGAVGTILDGLTVLLGVYILVLANTRTTPTQDPQLNAGTMIRVTDPTTGDVIGHAPVPEPSAPPVVRDVPPE